MGFDTLKIWVSQVSDEDHGPFDGSVFEVLNIDQSHRSPITYDWEIVTNILFNFMIIYPVDSVFFGHCRAGKPPAGLHLDCMKDGKMIQVRIPSLRYNLLTNKLIMYCYQRLCIIPALEQWHCYDKHGRAISRVPH
jgi:hypothetical protein